MEEATDGDQQRVPFTLPIDGWIEGTEIEKDEGPPFPPLGPGLSHQVPQTSDEVKHLWLRGEGLPRYHYGRGFPPFVNPAPPFSEDPAPLWPEECISTEGPPAETILSPPPSATAPAPYTYPQAATYRLNAARDRRYARGWFYTANHDCSAESIAAETDRVLSTSLPPCLSLLSSSFVVQSCGTFTGVPSFVRPLWPVSTSDEVPTAIREPIPGMIAMPTGVPFVILVNGDPNMPLTIACSHDLESLAGYSDGPDIVKFAEKLWQYTYLGVFADDGTKLADPLFATDGLVHNMRSSGGANDSVEGSYSAAVTVGEGQGNGNVKPAVQASSPVAIEVISRITKCLHWLWRHIMPKMISAAEWEALEFFYIDNNVFGCGGLEPHNPAVQVNISAVCGGGTLERSIGGGQGGIHPDVKDHPDSWTLTHTLYFFPPGTDLGPFFLMRPGLYIKPRGVFIEWTAFKGGHPHSGSAPTVYDLESFHHWQDTFTVEARKYGYINRINFISYPATMPMTRESHQSISPALGFGNDGMFMNQYATDTNFAAHGYPHLGSISDWMNRIARESTFEAYNRASHSSLSRVLVHPDKMMSGVSWLDEYGSERYPEPVPFIPHIHRSFVSAMRARWERHHKISEAYHIRITSTQWKTRRKKLAASVQAAPDEVSVVAPSRAPPAVGAKVMIHPRGEFAVALSSRVPLAGLASSGAPKLLAHDATQLTTSPVAGSSTATHTAPVQTEPLFLPSNSNSVSPTILNSELQGSASIGFDVEVSTSPVQRVMLSSPSLVPSPQCSPSLSLALLPPSPPSSSHPPLSLHPPLLPEPLMSPYPSSSAYPSSSPHSSSSPHPLSPTHTPLLQLQFSKLPGPSNDVGGASSSSSRASTTTPSVFPDREDTVSTEKSGLLDTLFGTDGPQLSEPPSESSSESEDDTSVEEPLANRTTQDSKRKRSDSDRASVETSTRDELVLSGLNLADEQHASTPLPVLSEASFEVEKIIGHQTMEDGEWYLVRWKDYEPGEDSWVPQENLEDAVESVQDYHKRPPPTDLERAQWPPLNTVSKDSGWLRDEDMFFDDDGESEIDSDSDYGTDEEDLHHSVQPVRHVRPPFKLHRTRPAFVALQRLFSPDERKSELIYLQNLEEKIGQMNSSNALDISAYLNSMHAQHELNMEFAALAPGPWSGHSAALSIRRLSSSAALASSFMKGSQALELLSRAFFWESCRHILVIYNWLLVGADEIANALFDSHKAKDGSLELRFPQFAPLINHIITYVAQRIPARSERPSKRQKKAAASESHTSSSSAPVSAIPPSSPITEYLPPSHRLHPLPDVKSYSKELYTMAKATFKEYVETALLANNIEDLDEVFTSEAQRKKIDTEAKKKAKSLKTRYPSARARLILRACVLSLIFDACNGDDAVFACEPVREVLQTPCGLFVHEGACKNDLDAARHLMDDAIGVLKELTAFLQEQRLAAPEILKVTADIGTQLWRNLSLMNVSFTSVPRLPKSLSKSPLHTRRSPKTSTKRSAKLLPISMIPPPGGPNAALTCSNLVHLPSSPFIAQLGLIVREALNAHRSPSSVTGTPIIGDPSLHRVRQGLHPTSGHMRQECPDFFAPIRATNDYTKLALERFPPQEMTKRESASQLASYMALGHGTPTKSHVEKTSMMFPSFAACVAHYSTAYTDYEDLYATLTPKEQKLARKPYENLRVWGQPCPGLALRPLITTKGARFNTMKTIEEKFSPYWSPEFMDAFLALLGPLANQDPRQWKGKRIAWLAIKNLLQKHKLPCFVNGLTQLQFIHTLIIMQICEEPTIDDIAEWISRNPKLGAYAGLHALGFNHHEKKDRVRWVKAAFQCVYDHLDIHMTAEDKAAVHFGVSFVEHILCKVPRWERSFRGAKFSLRRLAELAVAEMKDGKAWVKGANLNDETGQLFPFPLTVSPEQLKQSIEKALHV